MQHEGGVNVKSGKQQNLQQLLNQSLPLSQAMQSAKGRSNSIKQQQNMDGYDNYHSQGNNTKVENDASRQTNVVSYQARKQSDGQTNNGSNSQIQTAIDNYQNCINYTVPVQSQQIVQQNKQILNQQQLQNQLQQATMQHQMQTYMSNSQKDQTNNQIGNLQGASVSFRVSNQSPSNNNSQNQHFSLIQFNINQNLKSQKSRTFQNQQQQNQLQQQNQQFQQDQMQQNQPQNSQVKQQKKNEKTSVTLPSSNSISANTTNTINKGKNNLVLQDTSLQSIQSQKIFSPNSLQQQQPHFSSQNTSQHQSLLNNNFGLNQQQNETNQQQQQQLTASGATIMNMMNVVSSNNTQQNKYLSDLSLQKQMHLLQNNFLAAQLQVQQNKVNNGQSIGQKVAKAQSTIMNKKSFTDKSSYLQSSNSITSGQQSQPQIVGSAGGVQMSIPGSQQNSSVPTLNNINMNNTNTTLQNRQIQGSNHQYQKSSITPTTQDTLSINYKQNTSSTHQSSLTPNTNLTTALTQQLATKIQNINKNSGKIQQNSYVNRSTNNEYLQQQQQQIQNQQQQYFQINEKLSPHQQSQEQHAQNVINPISSIENYKTTIEAYKRMVDTLNKQIEQPVSGSQNKTTHQQKASLTGPIIQNTNQLFNSTTQSGPVDQNLVTSSYLTLSQTQAQNFNDTQDQYMENVQLKLSPQMKHQRLNDQRTNNQRQHDQRQSQNRNYEDISTIVAKYSNNNNSSLNKQLGGGTSQQNQNNQNNNSYYNNSNQNNINILHYNMNKSNGEINEMIENSMKQIDLDEKSGIPSQTNINQINNSNSGINSYSNIAGNTYNSYQQTQNNPQNRLSENVGLKQSLVETPTNSSQNNAKQSKLGNLLKFQFNGQEQGFQNNNAVSQGMVQKKKKSDTIGGTVSATATSSNLRRTPNNSVTQNPLLFGQPQQAMTNNLQYQNSPPNPSQQSLSEKNPIISMPGSQQPSFQLNLNKTKQLFSNQYPYTIESAGGGNSQQQQQQIQQLQINSAKLDNSNAIQRNLISHTQTNSTSSGAFETTHFRPSSTISTSKLKHQNIITPSKSFSQIFPPPIEHSKASSTRSLFWIFNTPSSFLKAYLLDTKYFAEYKHSLNNYVDFITNIKHPYIFEDNSDKDNKKKAKSHKISSILAGLTLSQENDKLKNIRQITDTYQNKSFQKWKESLEQKVSQYSQNQYTNNYKVNDKNESNKINSSSIQMKKQQLQNNNQKIQKGIPSQQVIQQSKQQNINSILDSQ